LDATDQPSIAYEGIGGAFEHQMEAHEHLAIALDELLELFDDGQEFDFALSRHFVEGFFEELFENGMAGGHPASLSEVLGQFVRS
jgi:hypothetical protein